MRYVASCMAVAAATLGLDPSARSPGVSPPLSAISFLTGCWTGPSANGATIEEQNSAPSDNMVIGMTRYVRGGRVVDFEFTTIVRTDTSFLMIPHPKGIRSKDVFPLKEITTDRAVWENLQHDFPQRIIYRRGTDGSLVARIEGTTPRGDRHSEWTMHRCEPR